jgi:hypothetical protein
MEEMTGISAAAALGKTPRELFPVNADADEAAGKALRGETVVGEEPYHVPSGDRTFSSIYSPLRDGRGRIAGVVGMIRDLSEEKQEENKLRETTEQLRKLAAHLQAIREEESLRIAREIHDRQGGLLTALKIHLAILPEEPSASMKEWVQNCNTVVDELLDSVQKVALGLRPPILAELGLVAAIRGEVEAFTVRTRIPCHLHWDSAQLTLPEDSSIALFRILQEALTNVVRHAGATRVDVVLNRRRGKIHSMIRDNGKGFNPEDPKVSQSLGMVGMRERALAIGGEFSIRSAPGRGTTIAVSLPA